MNKGSALMQFAFTIGSIALLAIVAIQVFDLDVNEILDSAKSKIKK